MQFKKVISSVLVVILLLSLTVFSASASAAKALEFTVETSSTVESGDSFVKAGETIEVNVAIPEGKNPGVAFMQFDVTYNAEALDLDENSIITAIFTMGSPELDRAGIIVDEPNGRVAFKTDMRNAADIVETGTVVTLSFKVKEDVCAVADIAVDGIVAVNAKNDIVEAKGAVAELTVHDLDEGTKVAPTCTAAGSIDYKCAKCDAKISVVDGEALGHNIADATCTEDAACTRCGEKGADKATGHKFSAWSVEKEAEKGVDGRKVRTCSNCGEKETEVIPALAGGSFPVVAIVVIVVVAVAAAGFCVYWFVLRKK